MICPECSAEFVPGITECPDCEVGLVEPASARFVRPRGLHTVAVFRDVLDAELALSKLRSRGIDARLADCSTIGVAWNYSNALGGIKVQVQSSQRDEASEVLRADESAALTEIDAELGQRAILVCQECHSDAVEEVNNTRKVAAWFMLFGIPLVWFDKHNRCNQCGHRW